MSKGNIDKRIEEEAEKLAQQKAILAQLRARKAKIDRKNETRRKILVGAVILNRARKDQDFRIQLMAWLDQGLTAERDRSLFEFGNTPVATNDNAGEAEPARRTLT